MSLEKEMLALQKLYGQQSVGYANDLVKSKGYYSTGSLQLDAYLGGGFPKGRITEIKGPYSSGKTTAAIHALADCQRKGDKAIFADLEGTFDKVYAHNLGVDLEDLIYIPPMNGEDAMGMAEKLCKTGEIGLIVVDSIAALLPGKIGEDEYGKANMAFHAKLVGEMTKRFVPVLSTNNVAMVAINQLRKKPGVSFGNPEYSTGGESVGFYASVILDIRKSGAVEKDKDGIVIAEPRKIKIEKCKINNSVFRTMMVDIIYGEGLDKYGEVVNAGIDVGVIEKKGAWYSYNGAMLGQGKVQSKQFLKDNPEVLEEMEKLIWDKFFIPLSADAEIE
jgi:recombination protein RecA